LTSAIQDLRPGAWLVKCYDDDVGGCSGPPYWVPDGGLICELHAKARGILVEEEVNQEKMKDASTADESNPLDVFAPPADDPPLP